MTLLTRWEPFREWDRLQDEMNCLFNFAVGRRGDAYGLTPACDVHEDPEKFTVNLDIPGVDKKDIAVRVENDVLSIRAKRSLSRHEKREGYLALERAEGTYARSLALPNGVDAERVAAEYKNGVLVVTLPKRPEARPKQIDVKVG
ncbi:MAG: Hsp20/alpha crystallin family protein [Deltaproteobacteria bacterium]|nr:Hsp20/alpha crystallin family protein [Deltaproteobacteria bacterium]